MTYRPLRAVPDQGAYSGVAANSGGPDLAPKRHSYSIEPQHGHCSLAKFGCPHTPTWENLCVRWGSLYIQGVEQSGRDIDEQGRKPAHPYPAPATTVVSHVPRSSMVFRTTWVRSRDHSTGWRPGQHPLRFHRKHQQGRIGNNFHDNLCMDQFMM
jgi:hypothetical protein